MSQVFTDTAALLPAGMNSDPASWAKGLSPSKQYEWFVDCYRMRVDDDYAYGGGDVHGLYDPEHDGDSITADFLHFCKLAVLAHVVPQPWDWKACLEKAKKLLGFAFEKSDAQEKYGSENVFSVLMGGRSLRATAEQVYGRSCMNGADYGEYCYLHGTLPIAGLHGPYIHCFFLKHSNVCIERSLVCVVGSRRMSRRAKYEHAYIVCLPSC